MMGKEFETQVLDIDEEKTIKKLKELGAVESEEIFQRRYVYNIENDPNNVTVGRWIRLREAAGKSKLTYKNRTSNDIDGTEEIEVDIGNFDEAAKILDKLNEFKDIFYQENRRKIFTLGDIEFTIDTWPMIPKYLEIESNSEENVKKGLKLLELEGKDVGHIGCIAIYNHYGIDLHQHKILKFEKEE